MSEIQNNGATPLNEVDEGLALLQLAHRAVFEEPEGALSKRGLGRVHHRILFFVQRTPDIRSGELLRLLGVTKQAIHRPMQDLIAKGLIESKPAPDNKRARQLRLTRAGVALEKQLTASQSKRLDTAFKAAGLVAARGWRDVMRALLPGIVHKG